MNVQELNQEAEGHARALLSELESRAAVGRQTSHVDAMAVSWSGFMAS